MEIQNRTNVHSKDVVSLGGMSNAQDIQRELTTTHCVVEKAVHEKISIIDFAAPQTPVGTIIAGDMGKQ